MGKYNDFPVEFIKNQLMQRYFQNIRYFFYENSQNKIREPDDSQWNFIVVVAMVDNLLFNLINMSSCSVIIIWFICFLIPWESLVSKRLIKSFPLKEKYYDFPVEFVKRPTYAKVFSKY